jgi:2-(1,2-epoxy-1,2-dihydrophenyl)acetyl-CoA isomerase
VKEYEGLSVERDGGVATIRLDRPEKLNAILFSMIEGIADLVGEFGRDEDIRAIVITGTGRAFSSGDDIVGGMGERSDNEHRQVGMHVDLGPHHRMVKTIMSAPKPVIAAINGRCHGAGWVTALACDFRVAHSDVLIGDIRSGKAIFAGQTVPLVLPRLIGQSRAMDLLMTGRVMEAQEAFDIGLLARLWSPEDWEQEVEAFVAELANGPTVTYAAWKLTVNRSVLQELDGYTDFERRLAAIARDTDDAREGRQSFIEKREPEFTGR